jgi:acyl transferase domain-containing protein
MEPIAIVGAGAVMPDATNAPAFWQNVQQGLYSITEVTSDRWDPALYYDADPTAPDKTYSKIGGWVRAHDWDPVKWRLPLPPRVVAGMDVAQQWAIGCTREALQDYGYPARPLDLDRTAVIFGNAMAGERHYLTSFRVYFPEYARELEESPSFSALPEALRRDITRELHHRIERLLPEITEDSMPGELSNCLAGRIANLFNIHGPNYVTDAACASAMAAISAAVNGLVEHDFDAAITGGVDRNMGAPTFVKFCKIGALSGSGSRPYANGADGFVMGEGAALFVLKRLADAEQNGDRIYAVIRGIAGSSDGKGKGITAPNSIGQKICIERAWQAAGLSPATVTLMEGHGTSTRVGDLVEVGSMADVLGEFQLPAGSIALGSVKSNIGHLKGGAGAAGLLKLACALRDKVLPPSLHCEQPNPGIDFARCPLYVNTELRPWTATADGVRRGGLSAFGFGGTNFHAVLEEYIPHRLNGNGNGKRSVKAPEPAAAPRLQAEGNKPPLRGALVIGADSAAQLAERLRSVAGKSVGTSADAADTSVRATVAGAGAVAVAGPGAVGPTPPAEADLCAPERIAIDYADAADLADKCAKALKALAADQPAVWKALRAQGIFRGRGPAGKVAFLYTGQGSQYINMMRELRASEPIVAETFAEADRVMTPLLGKPLSDFIYTEATPKAEEDLRQTAITQPAVLATDLALTRLLAAYGIQPDVTMGHSLGEYGALVASGALPFADALEAVSARGREMTRVSMADNGRMAAVFAPLAEIERILKTIEGYVVIANINSNSQAVVGGASKAVEQAMEAFQKAGYNAVALPVSHAFHTSIVAPASEPLRRMLERLRLESPRVPIVANVDGQFYPMGPGVVPQMLDILARQIASPVQFVKGLQTLYDAGARVFVELGPKKALQGFAEDVLGGRPDVVSLFTNHPKFGDVVAFNQALCGLYAAGLGAGQAVAPIAAVRDTLLPREVAAPVVITGAALGLPGTERIFDDGNTARILRGEQGIDVIPTRFRRAIVDKHITRLVKSDSGAAFEPITHPSESLRLAGRGGAFDLEKEFDVPAERVAALDRVTQLAIAVGIDALRDAGIPLVMHYKTTSKGTQLPDRWGLPDAMRDDTAVIFASCWPGLDSFAQEASAYYADRARREQLQMLEDIRARMNGSEATAEVDRRIAELRATIQNEPYVFDRRYIFRTLAMGHSQFAEFIGARGPNTQINAACASTTQAVALAEDWIRAGRCRRVVVIAADEPTSDHLLEWIGSGFLASGAAATDEVVEEAALPFDRRRHGMILGMGAAGLVVETAAAAAERGLRPICEVLSAVTANSAFHGTRLDVQHISGIMEQLVSKAEARGVRRDEIAPRTVFMSHETYTPARGGSAQAEIHALRDVFGADADRILIANTKGLTGHAMAAGIEDVVAVKALETGCVPPVANFKEVDPELGPLNLSKGGAYPVEYALRLGAGFGSQISMTLLRRTAAKDSVRPRPANLGYAARIADASVWSAWLSRMAGGAAAELEVVHHTLRLRDGRRAALTPAPVAKPVAAPVVAAQPAVVSAPAPTPVPALPANPIRERVLAIVAEKTGYPQDMLALDLDLEADLGVDTVKQADVFSSVRAAFDIPREENLKLRDFPTLAHVIRFVEERKPVGQAKAPAPPTDTIREKVLAIVAEKTGYPQDMLALDLDLEADLGVDTVKQADVFSSVRAAFDIPREENLKLRDFPTLAHVIRFVEERRPVGQAKTPAPPTAAEPPSDDPVRERVLAIVAEKTGYPRDMLDLDLDLEADLGVDTVKQADVFSAVRAAFDIPRDENLKLRDFPTLAHVIQFVHDRKPGQAKAPAPPAIDPVREKVLAIVAEKTGYPQDMLDLDLDLEADLGVDTVKQADVFSTVRAAFKIPRDENLKLRDFPTLAHVIRFAQERQSGVAAPTPAPAVEPARPAAVSLDAANNIPRRVPAPRLRPPLDMCKPTGVALGPGSRVLVMSDRGGAGDELAARLAALGVEVLRTTDAIGAGPVQGVYWLAALDREADIREMSIESWREALQLRVKSLFGVMRSLYGQSPFLVSATCMGGLHGYDEAGALAPMGGAVTGFTKTYKRERGEALVKAVDFEAERPPADIAEILLAETLRDPGAVEIGYRDGLRWTIGLEEQPAADGQPGLTLDKDTVFLITGAAGSIVSAITADLAAASGGIFYLLDLAPAPDPANPDLARFTNDKDRLKRDLFARIQASGKRATPAMVEKELAALERVVAAHSAIEAVRAAGGTAYYRSLNLTDGAAVARVIDQVRERHGRIDVLLHAAGMERSHFLPDKDPKEFDLVFDVKADGWFNLLRAIGDMPLGATVAFSSVAARFGNGGQADYSAANDLLCKITSSFRTTRPATRGIAIDWTAWGGIGMATRGSIPKMMEMAGIDMLPPEAGVPLIRRELTTGATRGELVVGQRLGILVAEWDPQGGLDTTAAGLRGPMLGTIAGMGLYNGLLVETTLDPAVQPFLHDHQIQGTPVLPGVMGIEAFAEAAAWLLPGWHIESIENVDFLAPFKFYRGEPRTLAIETILRPRGDNVLAECRLTGRRQLPNQVEPQITTHFVAQVRLAKGPGEARKGAVPGAPAGLSVGPAEIYRLYFHGPAYQVVEQAWRDQHQVIGRYSASLPDNHHPGDLPLAASPRLIELCFQTAGLWEMGVQGRMGLPYHIDRVRLWRAAEPAERPLCAVVTPDPLGGSFAAEVVDGAGVVLVELSGYRTAALPDAIEAEPLKPLQAVMSSEHELAAV